MEQQWAYPTYGAERARYVKIMPCDHQDATYTPNNDGTHTVSCDYCKIGKEAHTYVQNLSGYYCSKCKREDNLPDDSYYSVGKMTYNGTGYHGVADQVYLSKGAEYPLPDCADIDGYAFAGWAVVHNLSEVGDRPKPSNDETLYPASYQLPLTGNIILVARYYSTNLSLSDDKDNESLLIDNMTGNLNVTLKGRKLFKDGSWNTLCLPFSLTEEELAASQLKGYTGLKELDVDGYYDVDGKHYIYHEKVDKAEGNDDEEEGNNDEENELPTGYYDDSGTLYEGNTSTFRQTGFDATAGSARTQCISPQGKKFQDVHYRCYKHYETYDLSRMRPLSADEDSLGMNTWCLPRAMTQDKIYLQDVADQAIVNRHAADDKWVTLPLFLGENMTGPRRRPRTSAVNGIKPSDCIGRVNTYGMFNEPVWFIRMMKVLDNGGPTLMPNLVSEDGRQLTIVHLRNDPEDYRSDKQAKWAIPYSATCKTLFELDNQLFPVPPVAGWPE